MNFDWNELAFASKKPLNSLEPIFIAAPRELSAKRLTQLVQTYLPQANILLGLAKEDYVDGFKGQPQFKMLRQANVQPLLKKLSAAKLAHQVATLSYFQRDAKFIFEKLGVKKVVLVYGSWQYTFHTRPEYYTLVNRHIAFAMVSPFSSESEAKTYAATILPPEPAPKGYYTETEMLTLAENIALRSFDNSFQTGVTLGRKQGSKYEFMAQTFNKVVPYQTYAMHFGPAREVNFSPPHDLNHYDTVHAEVELVIKAQKAKLDLRGTTIFINLLPCPMCARMFAETDIEEFVYRQDHSDGYAVKMLKSAGKKVRRIVK